MLKRLKENTTGSPKTTKKGLWYSFFTLILGFIVLKLSATNPEIANFIKQNEFEIYSALTMLVTAIVGYFSAKKDDE